MKARIFAAWIGFGMGLAAMLPAANLELTFRERGGPLLSGLAVHLESADGFAPGRWRRYRVDGSNVKVLDPDGRVRFEGLPLGSYRVWIEGLSARGLIPLDRNPLVPATQITIRDADESLSLPLEVWRGHRVSVFLDLPDERYGLFGARLTHRGTGRTLELAFPRDRNRVQALLPEGVWEVVVSPGPGYVLTGIDQNNQPLAGDRAVLDVDRQSTEYFLTFVHEAPCVLEGVVVEKSGKYPAVQIRATLVEPGPWWQAARDRGARIPERVEASPSFDTEEYEMRLMPGTWRLEAVGPQLVAAEPEATVLTLASGEHRTQDFTVELDSSAASSKGAVLRIPLRLEPDPRDPVFRILGQAFPATDPSTPSWSGPSSFRNLRIRGLPDGDYVVVGAHPDYLEGRLEIKGYRGGSRDPKQPPLVMTQGATFELLAKDPAGQRRPGASLRVERLDPLPDLLATEEKFLKAKAERTLLSDQSGFASASGFYAGKYLLTAAMDGVGGQGSHLELRTEDGDWQRELEVVLGDDETLLVEARERPATLLEARLQCSDAWTLPDAVEYRLLDAARPNEPPVLEQARVLLDGERSDRLTVGPVDDGTWLLAIRPEGFQRWTWAYGAHSSEQAEGLLVSRPEAGEEASGSRRIDLGLMEVECGPAIDIEGQSLSDAAFPDPGQVEATFRLVDPVDKKPLTKPPFVRRGAEIWELRDLPHGTHWLEVALEHPCFLPTSTLHWTIPVDLERGFYEDIVLEVDRLGSALELKWPEPARIRLSRPDHEEVLVVEHRPPKTMVPSLEPGHWTVTLCPEVEADGCGRPPAQWRPVLREGAIHRLPKID